MAGRNRETLVYSVVFLAGELDRPGALARQRTEGPVLRGCYGTAVEVLNPDAAHNVAFTVTATLTQVAGAKGAPVIAAKPCELELQPRTGVRIDSTFIRNLFARAKAKQALDAPAFVMGWVVLEADAALDVVAIYTTSSFGAQANPVSMQSVRIAPPPSQQQPAAQKQRK